MRKIWSRLCFGRHESKPRPGQSNLLMTSDHFVVPLHPDYFSAMALSSLTRVLPRWKAWATTAHSIDVLRTADYPFPEPRATFVGAVIQKYRPRKGAASKAFQHWIDQLVSGLKNQLIPRLVEVGLLNVDEFKERIGLDPWEPIIRMILPTDKNGISNRIMERNRQILLNSATAATVNISAKAIKQDLTHIVNRRNKIVPRRRSSAGRSSYTMADHAPRCGSCTRHYRKDSEWNRRSCIVAPCFLPNQYP